MALRKEDFGHSYERSRAMENNQPTVRRDSVFVEIDRKLYYRIQFVAALKHITMYQYVEQILDEMVPEINDVSQPGHPLTLESIERLEQIGEELFRRNSFQCLGNSVEEIREMREERLRHLMGEDTNNE